ncbi:MAG TPA: PP2C family serine/threonine-protein phosphatase [Candidatus Sulfotelmatobacter sp.]|nr:PP2C family serine/threonine-protein phosphatase [Candidatus Sulfotelmatobacter sp.]
MIIEEFNSTTDLDDAIICYRKLAINGVSFEIDACTTAGSKDGISRKPNEDTFSVIRIKNLIIAAVFDGCSSQRQILSLKDETGAHFASHYLKSQFEKITEDISTTQIIRQLNQELLKRSMQFEGATLDDVHTLPASTATQAQINIHEDILNISHVGDTFCILQFVDNHMEFVTIDRNRKYDEERFALIKRIAKEKHITPREARKDERVGKAIHDMFQESYNKADGGGQGVINGDPNAEQYFQDISFSLLNIKSILIGSDGLIPPGWDEQKEKDREKIFSVLETKGVRELIRIKQKIENNDPNWQFVRYKHSDDATGIYIKIRH